jgi:hypothetical protein
MDRILRSCLWLPLVAGCVGGAHLAGDAGDGGGDAAVEADGSGEALDDGRGDGDHASTVRDDAGGAEADADPCGPASCANDPVDGPVGAPCREDYECGGGLMRCWPEHHEYVDGIDHVSWMGGYCAVLGIGGMVCDPGEASTCPTGSLCVPFGTTRTGIALSGCFDDCAPAAGTGEPWANNCDCRDGYRCDLMASMCLPGCVGDGECCEIWRDENRNGVRDRGELTHLGPERCTDTCDPCRYDCVRNGCPGGACRMGGPCAHDADCPAMGRCFSEFDTDGSFPGGLCTRERCDLIGRECPSGSGCGNLGSFFYGYRVCLVPCPVGIEPGAPGNPCRDVDPPGPSPGDYACRPAGETAFWFDETVADGFCWAGRFPGGDQPFGSECLEESDECVSPHGLGQCLALPGFLPFCSAQCNATLAGQGMCDTDPAAPAATGVCMLGWCTPACSSPGAPLGANGCSRPRQACYLYAALARFLSVRTGVEPPAGFCLPACGSDDGCRELWGDERPICDLVSGECVRG